MSDNRYNETFAPDSPIAIQGDEQIVGMDARTQPERLETGYAQYLQNMRLDTLAPTVRKGMAKQTNAITPVTAPLLIPFTVGSSAVISYTSPDGIFATTVFADPNNNNAQYIFLATQTCVYTFNALTSAVTTIAYPANEIVETIDNSTAIFQDAGQVYLLRGDIGTSFTVSSITGVISGTSATVTLTTPVGAAAPNGLSTNMYVRISGCTQSYFNGDFQITTSATSAFTITTTSALTTATATTTGTITCNRLKTPLVWNGNFASSFTLNAYGVISQNFYNMPASKWAVVQQNRAMLQYTRSQIIMSAVNNPSQYDIINGVFGFNIGTNDYVVGVAPYQNTQTIVFMRNSVWLINGVNGDVAAMTTQLISNQLGCCSRNSIAVCGSNVLFLNERGVYLLQPGLELALRGNALPLSAPIDEFIQTINYAALNAPVAAYYLNRYYIAVPIGTSTRNNAIFVYNFINEGWESYDTLPNGMYADELQVMLNAQGTPTLYIISYEGGLYAYEQNQQDDFAAAGSPANQYLINGQMLTRRFSFASPGLKRFNRVNTTVVMDGSSTLSAQAQIVNPSGTKNLPSITNSSATSGVQITFPAFVNQRGYGLQIFYQNTNGRCQILNYSVGAYIQDLKTVKQAT